MQARFGRRRRPPQSRIARHIDHPQRLLRMPDAPDDAAFHRLRMLESTYYFARVVDEIGDIDGWNMPGMSLPEQLGLLIDGPECAVIPFQGFADGLNDVRYRN